MSRRPTVLVLLVVALVAALLAPAAVVGAQENTTNATATPTPTATDTPAPPADSGGSVDMDELPRDGEYTLAELRRSGTRPAGAPSSVRYLPDGSGAVAVRYEPAAPLQNGMTFLPERTTLNTDDIQFYSTRFGVSGSTEYTVHVVFWQRGERTVTRNGSQTTETVPVNQREHTFTIRPGYGYDTNNVTLPSHYAEPYQATMWLTQDGQPVDGARWTFRHQTVQSEQAVGINSRGDLWWWAGTNIFLILIPGLLGSAVASKGIIRKTGRGPDKSATWWALFVIAPALLVVVTVGFFRTAQLAARAPQVFGVFAVLVGFIAMLETMGRDRRTDEFIRDELDNAEAPTSERLRNRIYREKARVHTVPSDEGLKLIKTGIRPFLARLLASPAIINRADLETDIKITRGPDDYTFIADPDSDEPLDWTPAHFALDWSLIRAGEGGWRTLIDRVRWQMLAIPAFGAVIGLYAGRYLFDAGGGLALAGAAVAFLIAAVEARDGVANFEPAHVHYRDARQTIIPLTVAFQEAKTVDELRDRVNQLLGLTAKEAKEISDQRDESLSEVIFKEETGIDLRNLDAVLGGEGRDEDIEPDEHTDPLGAVEDDTGGPTEAATDGGEPADE